MPLGSVCYTAVPDLWYALRIDTAEYQSNMGLARAFPMKFANHKIKFDGLSGAYSVYCLFHV